MCGFFFYTAGMVYWYHLNYLWIESEYLLSVMQCMYHVYNCTDIREEKKSCVDLIDVNVVVVFF